MTLNEQQEEILEAIWVASERKEFSLKSIGEDCAVEIRDADIETLEKEGLLIKSGDKILLSKDGKLLAEKVIRRHRLAETLIGSILKLKDSRMEEIACQVEHTLLPEIEESICILLGHPERAPDGTVIPRGKCCEKHRHTIDSVVTSLSDIEAGKKAKVMYIRPNNHAQLHQLLSFGLNPGVCVTVHQTTPAFCIRFENTELALDRETASSIFVLSSEEMG